MTALKEIKKELSGQWLSKAWSKQVLEPAPTMSNSLPVSHNFPAVAEITLTHLGIAGWGHSQWYFQQRSSVTRQQILKISELVFPPPLNAEFRRISSNTVPGVGRDPSEPTAVTERSTAVRDSTHA